MDATLITVRENGPLVISSPVKIVDHLGNEFAAPVNKPTVALCRCGASANRPFCDGSHKRVNFLAPERAPAAAAPPSTP
jgi:CDGSH-type Zn-finger protein